MATHGYGGLGRAMVGSVSDLVAREANAPAILVARSSGPHLDLLTHDEELTTLPSGVPPLNLAKTNRILENSGE